MSKAAALPTGASFGERYLDVTVIASGRSCHVYRATDKLSGEVVALKVFADHNSIYTAQSLRQLLCDFALRTMLRLPEVPGCKRFSWQHEAHSVSAFVPAVDLAWMVARTQPPSEADAGALIRSLLALISKLARAGCALYDIHPHNIMFKKPEDGAPAWGDVVHFDFGLSAITRPALAAELTRVTGVKIDVADAAEQSTRLVRELCEVLYFALTRQDPKHRYAKRLRRDYDFVVHPPSVALLRPDLGWSAQWLDQAFLHVDEWSLDQLAESAGLASDEVALLVVPNQPDEETRRALSLAIRDRGCRALAITGPANSGKSLLLWRLLGLMPEAKILRIMPTEEFRFVRLESLGSLLQHAQRALGHNKEQDQVQLARFFATWPTEGQPMVIVVDDMHAASEETWRLLKLIPAEQHVLMLVAGREPEQWLGRLSGRVTVLPTHA